MEDDLDILLPVAMGRHFNPRPPCGGRRESIEKLKPTDKFQSTSPVWRTTIVAVAVSLPSQISIHVPRVEDDSIALPLSQQHCYFNPRPPCGGRLDKSKIRWIDARISIHVPRVEDDGGKINGKRRFLNFNPRPPCGGRPIVAVAVSLPSQISIHVPRVEDDIVRKKSRESRPISIHVPRVEDD